ncbi:MAG: DMT family transporter [Candidatus Rifleibacteriota bacterium]
MTSELINGSIRVAIAAGIWGAAYPLTKLILSETPPIILGFLRFSIAAFVFMLITRSLPMNGVVEEDRQTFYKLAFWGVFILILGMNFGLIWAPGIAASVLSGTPPLFTVILAAFLLSEPMLLRHFISIGFAMSGLWLLSSDLSGSSMNLPGWKILAGCLLTLVPQFSWAMYGIVGKKLSEKYAWPTICRDTFSLGALMLLPFAVFEGLLKGPGLWNQKSILILFYLAIMNSVITYSLWNSALKMIPVSTASFLIYLQPVSGAILSFFLFGEKPGSAGFFGIGLIFTALLLAVRAAPQTKPLPEPAVGDKL